MVDAPGKLCTIMPIFLFIDKVGYFFITIFDKFYFRKYQKENRKSLSHILTKEKNNISLAKPVEPPENIRYKPSDFSVDR
jgi:hypothetical protein